MKILYINSSGHLEGGVETSIASTKRALTAKGHEVRILTSDLHPEKSHFSDYEFPAIDRQAKRKYLQRIWNTDALAITRQVVRDFDPDVIHLHTMQEASPSVLAAMSDRRVVATVHGPEAYTRQLLLFALPNTDFRGPDYTWRNLSLTGFSRYAFLRTLTYPVFRHMLRRVDVMISLSTYMQTLLRNEGLESKYLPIGVEPLPRNAMDSAARTLIFAGRLEKIKGVHHLINSMRIIREQEPDARLIIAGDGVERPALTQQVHDLGLHRSVTFLGHVSREELARAYGLANLAVVPSTWPEPFGLAGVEAMSAGRPVVAADVGGVRDWLEPGSNGTLVPGSDPESIANAVLDLWRLGEGLLAYSDAARATAERFSVAHYNDSLELLYFGLLGERKAPSSTLRLLWRRGSPTAGNRIEGPADPST